MTSVIHSFWQWLGSSTMSSLCVNEGNIKLIILKLSVKNINLSYFYTILINHHPHHYHPRHHRIGINMNDKINYANEKELTTWWQSLSSFESPPCWTLSPFIEHNLRIHTYSWQCIRHWLLSRGWSSFCNFSKNPNNQPSIQFSFSDCCSIQAYPPLSLHLRRMYRTYSYIDFSNLYLWKYDCYSWWLVVWEIVWTWWKTKSFK